jgi:hypothetical protein
VSIEAAQGFPDQGGPRRRNASSTSSSWKGLSTSMPTSA